MPDIKTILVTGSHGQLGRSLSRWAENDTSEFDFMFVTREQLDLSDDEHIVTFFEQHKFDLIINCAAYTAVDKAEFEFEVAEQINHSAVKKIAEISAEQGIKLIHISTDYVFNGKQYRPYREDDETGPQGVYGATKLSGEQSLLEVKPNNALIIRTSWVYSEFGKNFVKTMLKLGKDRDTLKVISDQVGSPTYAYDLAEAIMTIVKSGRFRQETFDSSLVHYSNEGACSWYDFATLIFELSSINCKVIPIDTDEYPTAAYRPSYSLLSKTKIKQQYGVSIPNWKDSLQACLTLMQRDIAE